MKKSVVVSASILGGVLVTASRALAGRDNSADRIPSPETRVQSDALSQPYEIQLSGYWAPLSPEVLAYRADIAIEGDVVAISNARWSTPSGAAPDGWKPGERFKEPQVIYRSVTVRVADKLYGAAGAEVTFAVLGGSVDSVSMSLAELSMPGLVLGDRVMVFLIQPDMEWRLGKQDMGLLQGYVLKDGKATHPEIPAMATSELAARVRAEAARRAAGAIEPAVSR